MDSIARHVARRVAAVTSWAAIALIAGCKFELPAPPPEPPIAAPPVAVSHSTIAMPIVVDVQALKAELETELKSKPLFAGHSPDLGAKLLAEEKSIFQKPEKIIDVAYRPAECQVKKVVTRVKRVVKIGEKTVDCLLKPWKWGKCVTDVFGDVWEDVVSEVTECTKEQLEAARIVYTPIEQIAAKIIDTSVVLNYSGQLQNLSLALNGNVLDAHLAVKVRVSADVKAGVLTATTTAKGVLACDSVIELDAKVATRLVQKGEGIAMEASIDDFHPELKKLCIPGAVQIAEAWTMTSPEVFGLSKLLEAVVQKQLQAQAEKALDKAADGLPLNDAITKAVFNLRGAKHLAEDVWLKVEPTKVLVSQIEGKTIAGNQTLAMTAGLDTDLTVIYGAKPNVGAPGKLPITLGAAGNAFHLVPRGTVSIAKMQEIVKLQLQAAAGKQLAKAGFEIPNVRAYQSGQLIVFGVQIAATRFWGPSGTIYLSGKPVYDEPKGAIKFERLDFTVETKSWLAKNVGAIGHDKVVEALAQKAVIPVDERLAKLLKRFGDFNIDIGGGAIKGTITSVRVGGIWMEGDALNFDLVLDGSSRLDVKL